MITLGATVTEDTDPNTDVSLGFSIETDLELLFLQISVLGPFACLRRVLAGNETELIGSEEECDTTLESGVCAILQRHGILLLHRDILLIPLPITLPNTPAAKASFTTLSFVMMDIIFETGAFTSMASGGWALSLLLLRLRKLRDGK